MFEETYTMIIEGKGVASFLKAVNFSLSFNKDFDTEATLDFLTLPDLYEKKFGEPVKEISYWVGNYDAIVDYVEVSSVTKIRAAKIEFTSLSKVPISLFLIIAQLFDLKIRVKIISGALITTLEGSPEGISIVDLDIVKEIDDKYVKCNIGFKYPIAEKSVGVMQEFLESLKPKSGVVSGKKVKDQLDLITLTRPNEVPALLQHLLILDKDNFDLEGGMK